MSSEDDTRKKTISEILKDIGLGVYAKVFEDNMILIENVEMMSEDDFKSIGIDKIGIRLKIKNACRTHLKGIQSSPAITKFRELTQKRKGGKRNNVVNEKTTRRLYVGWKHKPSSVYIMMSVKQGGGAQVINVDKECSIEELKSTILNIYFPNGRSEPKNLSINDLGFFIASFSGEGLPDLTDVGGFTVGRYFVYLKTTPVRLYLHTYIKEVDAITSDEIMVTEITPASVNGPLTQTLEGNLSEDDLPSFGFGSVATNKSTTSIHGAVARTTYTYVVVPGETPGATSCTPVVVATTTCSDAVIPAFVSATSPGSTCTPEVVASTSYTFDSTPGVTAMTTSENVGGIVEDSGTPEVTFHHRNRLSLHKRFRGNERISSTVFREFVEVFDSEDEELEQAIQASLLESLEYENPETEEKTVNAVLTELSLSWITNNVQTVIVSRKSVLNSFHRALDRKSFDLHGRLYIKFSGELGEDLGGPRREFFRLALDELQSSQMFCGPDDNKYFSHDVDLLEMNRHRHAGRLIALSFLHDGPAPHFLNPHVYDLMIGNQTDLQNFGIVILPVEVQNILKQLNEVDCIGKLNSFIEENGDWLMDNGINRIWGLVLEETEKLFKQVVKQIVYYRCSAEIREFINGMNDVGNFWDVAMKNPETFKEEFCSKPVKLSRESFEALCTVCYSEQGSNYYQGEQDSVYGWELFLQDIEEECIDVSFKELLSFITGADQVPPRGFNKSIDINFFPSEPGVQRLPSSSTCALQLNVPRGIADPDVFKQLMMRALKESEGFHKI